MKLKLFVIALIIGFVFSVSSQEKTPTPQEKSPIPQVNSPITKGRAMVGGAVTSQYNIDDRIFNIAVLPSYRYFAMNRLAVGAQVGYAYSYAERVGFSYISPYKDASSSHTLQFTPGIRFYAIKNLFVDVSAGMSLTKIRIESSSSYYYNSKYNIDENNIILNVGIGNSFFIKENIAIDVMGNFYHLSKTSNFSSNVISNSSSSRNSENKGLQLLVGFQLFF